jgi:hypothetical protein
VQHFSIQGTRDKITSTVDVVVISGEKNAVDVASGEVVQVLKGSAHDVQPYGGVECSLL